MLNNIIVAYYFLLILPSIEVREDVRDLPLELCKR
jgi:hypothetical protein